MRDHNICVEKFGMFYLFSGSLMFIRTVHNSKTFIICSYEQFIYHNLK